MDIKTGIVGEVRGISWQSLREALYVEPAAGIKSGSPSKQQLRSAADGLVRAGLIASMSRFKKLIFKCLLAETDITKQNKVNTKSTREVNTSQASVEAKSSYKVNTPKTGEVNTPPSVRDIKSSTSLENPASQHDDDKILIFSKKLSDKEIVTIRSLLKGFDFHKAQMMLDELAGHMAAKQIDNPVGYFRTIVRDAKAGVFHPERANKIEADRKKQAAIQKQIKESLASSLSNQTNQTEPKKPRAPKPNLVNYVKNLNKNELAS